jgi:hypothetical protein
MQNAEAVFQGVAAQAESIANDAEQVFEIVDVGDEIRQGDLYITRIKDVPTGATKSKAQQAQLAPGTTQGSRHCLRSLDGVTLHTIDRAGPLDGPIIEAREGCAIDHPEHGNIVLPAGVYAITYQRAFGEELRAVMD